MAIRLRTRLFLTVAIVLAGAIAASSLLSRRATLVEVRQIVSHTTEQPAAALEPAKRRIERDLAQGRDLGQALAAAAAEAGRPLVVVRPDKQIAGASNPDLSAARVRTATPDGDLAIDVAAGGGQTTIAVRGARPVALTGRDGLAIGSLYALPVPERDPPETMGRLLPPWMLATVAVAAVALVLTFTLSQRILEPVGELTAAAGRMQRGELGVQVNAGGHDEIGELARAFNAMAAQLAETEQQRRQMVSDVAHELRSPVTNLRCGLEAIQDGLATADRASIDALHEETLFLQRLIADLQDLALAEAGRLDLRIGEVDVEDVVRRAASSMATSPGAPIAVEIAQDLPRIPGDDDRIAQVLRNLLSNARQHTPADGRITIAAAPAGAAVRIVVRDTGAGIPPEHLPRVFDRFYRADQSRARATGGAGLGLAIARQMVLAHGGTIRAESAGEGLGAAFILELPVHPHG